MKECKHENRKRLYERGDSWTSTEIYKCQECGMLFKLEEEEVKVNSVNLGETE